MIWSFDVRTFSILSSLTRTNSHLEEALNTKWQKASYIFIIISIEVSSKPPYSEYKYPSGIALKGLTSQYRKTVYEEFLEVLWNISICSRFRQKYRLANDSSYTILVVFYICGSQTTVVLLMTKPSIRRQSVMDMASSTQLPSWSSSWLSWSSSWS